MDWTSQEKMKIRPMAVPREFEKAVRRQPEILAHAGDFSLLCSRTSCSSSVSSPVLSGSFDAGEPFLDQPDRREDIQQELQVFGLPVFRDIDREVGGQVLSRAVSSRPEATCS